jgi:hypothetical protein
MFIKKLLTFIFVISLFSTPLVADQFYGGFGLSVIPGQPDMEVNRSPFIVAYETAEIWRFSYADTEFQKVDQSDVLLKTTILGVERVWTNQVSDIFTVAGAFGVGYYSTDLDGSMSGNGRNLGLLATITARLYTNETSFLQASFQFRNAAIAINKTTVNGGHRGIFISYGLLF